MSSSPASTSETTGSGSDRISELYNKLADAARAKDDWELLLSTLSICSIDRRDVVTDAQLHDAENLAHALLSAVADIRSFRSSSNAIHSNPSFELENARSRILEARHVGNFQAYTFMSAIERLFTEHDICGSVMLIVGDGSSEDVGKLLITGTYATCTGAHHVLARLLPAPVSAGSGDDASQKQDSPERFRGLLLDGIEYMQKGLDGGEVETIMELCDRLLESAFPCKCISATSSQDAEHAHHCSWRDRLAPIRYYQDEDSEPPSPYDPYDWD